jgi:peptidoglycan/LPS O-acetylase OafA/YrhL
MIGYATRSLSHMEYLQANPTPRWDGSYFWFASNLYFFGAGIYAYRIVHELKDGSPVSRVLIPVIAVGLIGVLLFTEIDLPLQNPGRIDLVVWASGFAALCIWQSRNPSRWIASKFLEYTGERSYSVYLLHGPIILYLKDYIRNGYVMLHDFIGAYAFFLCAAAVLLLIMAAAEITYRLVEVPGIRLGRRIIGKVE